MLPCPLTLAILEAIGLKGQPIRRLTLRMNAGDYTTAEAEFLVVEPGDLFGVRTKKYFITAQEVGSGDPPVDTAVAPVECVEIPSGREQLDCPIPALQLAGPCMVEEFETTTLESRFRSFMPGKGYQPVPFELTFRREEDEGLDPSGRPIEATAARMLEDLEADRLELSRLLDLTPSFVGGNAEEPDEDLDDMTLEERSGIGTPDVWDRISIKAGSILERIYEGFPRRK